LDGAKKKKSAKKKILTSKKKTKAQKLSIATFALQTLNLCTYKINYLANLQASSPYEFMQWRKYLA
jgi:hypothetical protein